MSFTFYTTEQLIDNLEVSIVEKKLEQLKKRALTFLYKASPNRFYEEKLLQLSHSLESNTSNSLNLIKDFEKKYKVQLRAFQFDQTGQLINAQQFSQLEKETFNFFWRYFRDEHQKGDYNLYKPKYIKFIGHQIKPWHLKQTPNKCRTLEFPGNFKFLYFTKPNKENKKGIIFFLDNIPEQEKLLKIYISTIKSLKSKLAFDSKKISFFSDNLAPEEIDLIKNLKNSNEKYSIKKQFLWLRLNANKLDFFIGEKIAKSKTETLHKSSLVGFIILLILGYYLLYSAIVLKKSKWISIRYKLIVIFCFAVYLPLLGLFQLSYKGIHNRQKALENETYKSIQDILFKIDNDFQEKERSIIELFNMLCTNKEFTYNLTKDWKKNLALMMKAIGRPNQENCFNWLEARNSKSKQLFSTSNDSANERIENLNKVMSKISLEKFIPDRAKPKTQITNQAEFIIRTMLENPIIGFSSFFETPGKLKKMNFEGTDLYWYWNYIKDPKAKVAYICGNISLDQAIREYIDKISKNRFSLGNTSLRVKFYYSIENRWLDSEFKATDICQAMVKHSQITDQAINSKILLKNQKYLAVTFPGKKLKNLQILCLFPNKQIDLKISQMKTNIYIGVILILVVAILTGLLLTNSFLAPVGMLNQGIKALHRRETSFRLKIESSDELGELGEMFNQMMEEVNEMLLAGATQQCLIPKELPKIPGYELTLFNKMATDVGGDYCDALKLDENKFLIVLGDVTGHGVSSSLLTAMVKALVFQYSKTQGELPELLKCLSFMIFDLLKHRKLMTFCALILDTSKNEMMISNAGHPFPFLCSNEKFEGIEHTSLPLGVSKKRSKYDLTIRKIEPNQVFAMYTDGIAEATNIKGEVFGFDKVGKIICENIDSSSNAIKDKLLEEFWNHYSEPELDDDLTMVILKRVS